MKIRPLIFLGELLAMPRAPFVLMAICFGALLIAFTAQYAFGEAPCILCIWQRIPFGIAIALSGFVFWFRRRPGFSECLLFLIGVLFVGEAGLAFFHSGVELHWWTGTDGCVLDIDAVSVEALLATPVARCDVISWTFLGFSMANWNVLFSLGLALFSFLASWSARTGRKVFAVKKETRAKPVQVRA